MAHITEIKIDGLLGRSSPIHYKLERDVNIFFGENGCGKTTLLKILDAAMNRNGASMLRLPVDRAEVHIFSLTENRVIKHVWERKGKSDDLLLKNYEILRDLSVSDEERSGLEVYLRHSSEKSNDWRLTPQKGKNGKPFSTTTIWAHTFLPTTRLYLGDVTKQSANANKSKLSEDQLDELFAESVNRTWLVFYSQTLTEVRRIQEEGLRAVLDQVLETTSQSEQETALDPTVAYERIVNFLGRQQRPKSVDLGGLESFTKRYAKEPNLRRVVGNLDIVERSIEEAMAPIEKFKTTLETLFSRGKKVATAGNDLRVVLQSGLMLPMANLSSGEKHLLKLLLAAMTAEQNAVIIDEPELSMHIDWQRVFVRTMQALNPACQLIIASHSPEIMAEISDEKIFVL